MSRSANLGILYALRESHHTWLSRRGVDVDGEEVLRAQDVLGVLVRDAGGRDL